MLYQNRLGTKGWSLTLASASSWVRHCTYISPHLEDLPPRHPVGGAGGRRAGGGGGGGGERINKLHRHALPLCSASLESYS